MEALEKNAKKSRTVFWDSHDSTKRVDKCQTGRFIFMSGKSKRFGNKEGYMSQFVFI